MNEQNKNENREPNNSLTLKIDTALVKRLLLLITFTIVLYWGLTHLHYVRAAFNTVMSVLSPFLWGFCIAFIINVLLRPLEKLWETIFRKGIFRFMLKIKRPVCLLTSTVLVFGIIFAVLFMMIPDFKQTLTGFIDTLPAGIANAESWLNEISASLNEHGIQLPHINFNLDGAGEALKTYISEYGSSFLDKTMEITTSIISLLITFLLSFIFSLYMLSQKETLGRQIRKVLFAIMPEEKAEKVLDFVAVTDKTFTNFVTGQLTEALIIGILCYIGMKILHIPYASVVSVLVGFTALIPVFGAFVGTALGAVLILLTSPLKAVWFVIFIIILQQIEGNLIYPKVVGSAVGLPGIWVLAAVTVGGKLFGFFGMLICVPVASIIYTYTQKHVNGKLDTKKISIK